MSNLDDLKSIADEVLENIRVTENLKRDTLNRCIRKQHTSVQKILIPIACSLLIIATFRFSGLLNPPEAAKAPSSPEVRIMIDNSLKAQAAPDIEEARKSFGQGFMIPSELPEGFGLKDIRISRNEGNSIISSITLYYENGQKIFEIDETKAQSGTVPSDFQNVKIKGTDGYIKSSGTNTECMWFTNDTQYSLKGSVSKDEALRIANSMK